MADSHQRAPSSVAGLPRWSLWARRLGAAVVAGVVSAAMVGPVPVGAQIPELLPSTSSTQPTTTQPSSESTLLPPFEHLATTTTPPPGATTTTGLLTLPAPGPGSTLLPPATTAPARTSRTTTFDTLPVPPRTPLKVTTTTLQGSVRPSTLPVVDDREGGGEEAAFDGTLPFTPEDRQIQAAGLDRELGGGTSEDPVTLLASIAGGLLALVLLGVVGWLQSQVKGRPHLW